MQGHYRELPSGGVFHFLAIKSLRLLIPSIPATYIDGLTPATLLSTLVKLMGNCAQKA